MAKARSFEFWDADIKLEDGPQVEPSNDGMSLGTEFLDLCQVCGFVEDSLLGDVSSSQAAYLEDCLKSALRTLEEVEQSIVYGNGGRGQVVCTQKLKARKLLYSVLTCRDSLSTPNPRNPNVT